MRSTLPRLEARNGVNAVSWPIKAITVQSTIPTNDQHVSDAKGSRRVRNSKAKTEPYWNSTPRLSAAASFASPQPVRDGADRSTTPSAIDYSPIKRKQHKCITKAKASQLDDALLFASQIDRLPTAFVTINWPCLPSSTHTDLIARLSKIRDRMKSFIKRATGQAPVWIEVWENPGGVREHVHLAVFIPMNLYEAFKRAFHKWASVEADIVNAKAVSIRRIYDLTGLQRYLLKGSTPAVRHLFSVPARFCPYQGTIEGPRVRVSHSIGPTARKAARCTFGEL
jgi:hypothetical protein